MDYEELELDTEEIGGHAAPMSDEDRELIEKCLAEIFAD